MLILWRNRWRWGKRGRWQNGGLTTIKTMRMPSLISTHSRLIKVSMVVRRRTFREGLQASTFPKWGENMKLRKRRKHLKLKKGWNRHNSTSRRSRRQSVSRTWTYPWSELRWRSSSKTQLLRGSRRRVWSVSKRRNICPQWSNLKINESKIGLSTRSNSRCLRIRCKIEEINCWSSNRKVTIKSPSRWIGRGKH